MFELLINKIKNIRKKDKDENAAINILMQLFPKRKFFRIAVNNYEANYKHFQDEALRLNNLKEEIPESQTSTIKMAIRKALAK